jgi:peptidoglycan/LPS O-acetylase OafA/YrhL
VPQLDNPRLTRNNFDLLRLLFAGSVCLVHSYDLSGLPQLAFLGRILSPAVAVKSFFVVSGFLIFMSYERSSSLATYARKRMRRIYPAYFTVVMLCAVGLVAVSSQGAADYFSLAWGRYVLANLVFLNFLQPGLPGVFTDNAITAVNGALWTLKIEVMFYFSVPLWVFLLRRLSPLPVLLLVYCASVAYAELLTAAAARTGSGTYLELARQLPGQLSYFMAGAFFYYFLPIFERRRVWFLAAAALTLTFHMAYPLPLLEPLALATVVAFFALFLYVGNFAKYGDFSYGVYIIHFPVIQILVATGSLRDRPGLFLAAVILLTGIGAMAMWHLVEKRFLLRSSHYLASAAAGEASTDLAPVR